MQCTDVQNLEISVKTEKAIQQGITQYKCTTKIINWESEVSIWKFLQSTVNA